MKVRATNAKSVAGQKGRRASIWAVLLWQCFALPVFLCCPAIAQQSSPASSTEAGTASGAPSAAAPAPQAVPFTLPPDYKERLKNFKPFELPPEPTNDHEVNKVLDLGPIRQSTLMPFTTSKTIKLEASYNEPVSLREALDYSLRNSLPIKIAAESYNYQRWQFWGEVLDFLPNFSTGFTLTNSKIAPRTTSSSRVFQPSVRYPVFTGGNVLYTALSQYYRVKGWHRSYDISINDTLLDVYLKYTNLVLQNSLLQVRAKSVAISQSQLELNNTLYKSGNGTQFAIMQSRTQLAADKQALLTQQVAVRQASLALAFALNYPMAVNIVPRDEVISEQSIVDHNMSIDQLLDLALANRPDLRQYELFRAAAARNVAVAASPLYPQASFFTTYTHSTTDIFPGRQSNNSANNNVAGAGVFGGLFNTFQSGFSVSWSLPNLGATYIYNVVSARALSRQAQLQANQELLLVTEQVRAAYLTAITAREQIDTAAYGVASAAEALRLANLRLQTGLGSNLELIQAQRDYVTALTNQAQAIVISNQAQAQLLHDMGLISPQTLTDGYRVGRSRQPARKPT